MGLVKLEKGQILHRAAKDIVSTIEIVVKGTIGISNQFTSISLGVGGLLGIVEIPGNTYIYTYEALEECAIYSYSFNSEEDIPKVIKANPKITPILAAQCVETAAKCCDVYDKEYNEALSEYNQIMQDYSDYPQLCIKVGEAAKTFPEIDQLISPERNNDIPEWSFSFIRGLKDHDAVLRKNVYPLSLDIAIGIIMMNYTVFSKISNASQLLIEYRKVLKTKASAFISTMKVIRAKLNDIEKSEENGESVVTIVNALNTILLYSELPQDVTTKFEEDINEF